MIVFLAGQYLGLVLHAVLPLPSAPHSLAIISVLMGRDMSDDISAPEVWKSELDAINEEASLLLAAVPHLSVEERRELQSKCAALIERRDTAVGNLALEYVALIERRNTAIRDLLHSAFPRPSSQGIDKNFAPEAHKQGVLSDLKFKAVVAAARDNATRASRTVMRILGIKSSPGSVRVEQALADDTCSSDGTPIQSPQVSVSTTDTVDRSTIEASNSDLKDELTKILSRSARRLNALAAE